MVMATAIVAVVAVVVTVKPILVRTKAIGVEKVKGEVGVPVLSVVKRR